MPDPPSESGLLSKEDPKALGRFIIGLAAWYLGIALALFLNWDQLLIGSGQAPAVRLLFAVAFGTAAYAILIFIYGSIWDAKSVLVWRFAASLSFISIFFMAVSIVRVLTTPTPEPSARAVEHPFKIIGSALTLELNGLGDGTFSRNRVIEPLRDSLNDLSEPGLFAEGGVTPDDFWYGPAEKLGRDLQPIFAHPDSAIPCQKVLDSGGTQPVRIEFVRPLRIGIWYRHRSRIEFHSSFIDPKGDWLQLDCLFPTDVMSVTILAQGGMEFLVNSETPTMARVRKGPNSSDTSTRRIRLTESTATRLSWEIPAPQVGELYVAEWVYVEGKGPRPGPSELSP